MGRGGGRGGGCKIVVKSGLEKTGNIGKILILLVDIFFHEMRPIQGKGGWNEGRGKG